jgi:hypothetical protein
MKNKLCVIGVALALATAAQAGERKTFKLDATQAFQLMSGLKSLDGYEHLVKGPGGQEQVVTLAYDEDPAARLAVAHDEFALQTAFAEFTQALVNEKDPARIEAIRAVDQTVELEVITVDQLNLNANRIPPSVLAEVGLVCPTCVGK